MSRHASVDSQAVGHFESDLLEDDDEEWDLALTHITDTQLPGENRNTPPIPTVGFYRRPESEPYQGPQPFKPQEPQTPSRSYPAITPCPGG
jgi:hypothetical protein